VVQVPAPAPVVEEARDDEPSERTYTAAEVKALKREAQALRTRLREVEASTSDATTQLSATRERLTSLESEARSYRLRDAITAAANTDEALRGLDAALAAKLVEGVEWSDDGKPKAVGAALKTLVAQYPQLVAQAGPRLVAQGSASAPAPAVSVDRVIEIKRKSGNYPTM